MTARIGDWVLRRTLSDAYASMPRSVELTHRGDAVTYWPRDMDAERVRVTVDAESGIGHCECGRCGAVLRPLDKFCWQCGRRMVP